MTASSTAWNSTPGPWLPYAPVSAVTSSAKPVSVPSLVGADLDGDRHRVPGGRRGELLLAGELQLDRAPGAQHGEGDDVLGEHLLLAAEAAADPLGDHPDPVLLKPEHPAQRVAGEERHLRRRPQHEPAARVEPADRGVRLQRDVLHPLARNVPSYTASAAANPAPGSPDTRCTSAHTLPGARPGCSAARRVPARRPGS